MQPAPAYRLFNNIARNTAVFAASIALAAAAETFTTAPTAWADPEPGQEDGRPERSGAKPECMVYNLGTLLNLSVRQLHTISLLASRPKNTFTINGFSEDGSERILRMLLTDYGKARDFLNRYRFAKNKKAQLAILKAELESTKKEAAKLQKRYSDFAKDLYNHKDYAKFKYLMEMLELGEPSRPGRLRYYFYSQLQLLKIDGRTRAKIEEAANLKSEADRASNYGQELHDFVPEAVLTPNGTCN